MALGLTSSPAPLAEVRALSQAKVTLPTFFGMCQFVSKLLPLLSYEPQPGQPFHRLHQPFGMIQCSLHMASTCQCCHMSCPQLWTILTYSWTLALVLISSAWLLGSCPGHRTPLLPYSPPSVLYYLHPSLPLCFSLIHL